LGRVSNYINQNMAKFKQIYIRYVASIFCVFIIAVVSIIANQKKGFDIESIVTVCSIWLAGNFLVESLWKKTAEEAQKNKQKWLIGYGVTFVIAIIFENLSEILKAQKADIPNLIFESILYFYIACTVLLAIYVLLRQQKLDLPHCIGRIIFALLRAVGVYLVLNIAVILILEIIDALLVDIDTFRVELNIQLMLSALAYFPTCLLAVSDTSEDNAAFTKKFVSYVLLPCVWIAMFVIYLYVVKIFVTQEVPSNEIFSICASLFAIGMGSWFGYGLCQGMPDKIPVAEKDFMFSAISEEFGLIFSIALFLVCLNNLILMMNIASRCKTLFYRLVAVGLGVTYGVQVFLTVGGAIKFIPMTGVTLPFVSYGGSSILSSLIMFALINGMYNMRQDEGDRKDGRKQKTGQTKKKTKHTK